MNGQSKEERVLLQGANWKELRFFQKSEALYQMTFVFCERFLPKHGDRTVDQMVQAARSIKQNIAEGLTDGQTSFEVEIKLLGIAKGSNQELLEDFQDYLKHHSLPEWAAACRADNTAYPASAQYYMQRYDRLRSFCRQHSQLSDYAPLFYRLTDEEMANTAISLCPHG